MNVTFQNMFVILDEVNWYFCLTRVSGFGGNTRHAMDSIEIWVHVANHACRYVKSFRHKTISI